MPIVGSSVYDNTGKPYDVSKILTEGYRFDEKAYKKYSKVFMPVTYVLSYGLQFAALTALITHTICWHGKDIWRQWKKVQAERAGSFSNAYRPLPSDFAERRRRRSSNSAVSDDFTREDVHMRLMRNYKEAPTSWYIATFAIMIPISFFVVE